MSFLFSFVLFFFKLCVRERERGYIKLGIRRNGLKVYLSFFLMEFLWRIFPLLRANRLYAIFNTGLKKWLLRVRDIFFVFFYAEYLAFRSVRHEPCPRTNFLIIYFPWWEGIPTSVLGSQPIIWLLSSSFPCQATRVRPPSKNIWSPLWTTFFLNGHSLTACYC